MGFGGCLRVAGLVWCRVVLGSGFSFVVVVLVVWLLVWLRLVVLVGFRVCGCVVVLILPRGDFRCWWVLLWVVVDYLVFYADFGFLLGVFELHGVGII